MVNGQSSIVVYKLTFNPFQENTFIVADENNDCIIIDPGCSNDEERSELLDTIQANALKPVKLLNTHCHIDHFPGNKFVCDTFNLLPEFHELAYDEMLRALDYQSFFGFPIEASPKPTRFLKDGDEVTLGASTFKVFYTPGHSVGSISFYNEKEKIIISGDVLFYGSIGRYDIPGAHGKVLLQTLHNVMMKLPDDVKVYCGHGPETTIGRERRSNPFLKEGRLM